MRNMKMTIEQALEVLKYHNQWRLGSNLEQTNSQELTKALIIAIEVMEKKKEEIKLAYDLGYTDCMYDRKRNYEQFDNSLTDPAGDGDEKE